ncbi:type II secretion system F family protein [Thioalkalivibrio sulfidiphilus]|uniref:General secretory pathway protein F n=1 Tax=Thioalkalivibrio sulfidiphilus (strain HL-EbGR7) TaxID=396588 RepID=B8GR84_THISH|nr:type II secretion system F family protein [Thioalkalivibrio sulfidiphilus]ACL74338.1 general secretory pathway protein F [Thioalkalivibrio sulfidiphilus HL-EbGr7]
MPRFSYRARNAQGQPIDGQMEAPTLMAVADQLSSDGFIPVDIQPLRAGGASLNMPIRLPPRRPSSSEITLLARQLYALTKAGVPIIRGLNQLADASKNERMSKALREVVDDLESGRDLAGAMARHPDIFSPLFVSMVQVGEASGRLDDALLRVFNYMERERQTVNQIRTALRYPTFVVIAISVAIFILMAYVIPVFAQVFERFDLDLPLATRAIITVSNFVSAWWWLILGGVAAAWFGFRQWTRRDDGRLWWDRQKLRFPVVGDIVLRASLARFARAFAMASRSGVPLLQALNVVSRTADNAYIAGKVRGMREGIERGETIARTAAASRVFTPLVMQMIAVGEETGQVDEMLDEVAEFYETEVDYDVRRLGETIQPVLVVAVGVIVFILALGVFLPMWDLTQIAGR